MSERAKTLADEFEKAVAEFAAAVENVPESKWGATSPEGWTLAATAQHVAGQFPLEMEFITAAAEGRALPGYTWDDINNKNDTRAANEEATTRDEVLKTLRQGAASTAAYIRGLSDDQLDRKGELGLANGAAVSTEQLIQGGVLIDHVRGHLQSIRTSG